MNDKNLNDEIEELDLADLEPEEIERVVTAFSPEGIEIRRARKKVRYQLYRLKTEKLGGAANVSEPGFKEIFEKQAGFNCWRFFAETWDVSISDPYKVISREISETEEWDNVVASKFPQIKPGGKIVYPDLQVKEKVLAESKKRQKSNKKG